MTLASGAMAGNHDEASRGDISLLKEVSCTEKSAVTDTETGNTTTPAEPDLYDRYLQGRLEIGTRVKYSKLTDSKSGDDDTFLGTIYALDEIQDYTPDKLFIRYYFTNYFGIELAYDSIEAETIAPSDLTVTKTDGDVSLAGPTVALIGRYPNSSQFTPYIFMGVGFYSGDFEEADNWAVGDNGVTRIMEVDNAVGVSTGAGCAYRFTDHLALDLSLQYTAVEADATFYRYKYGTWTLTRYGSFPLDNISVRAGFTYQF
ncbi:OmpW family outer membrane protein [Desulfogranum japonicum]|uniref:OmpW family outer membrane protein n=1 Tax=Desulfogranum japonicum TaxID=231447 RepID=UPI0004189157|nr:OmpW family outer membrane protein [Desulfogranum japonicum]